MLGLELRKLRTHHHQNTTCGATMTTYTQTTTVNGKRVRLVTKDGKMTVKDALPTEDMLQAAQVARLRKMPEYGAPPRGRFLLAGDMNAERRGPKARANALKTGMTAGEPDLRIYMDGGRLGLIENKVGNAPLTPSQKARHPDLARLGHPVTVIRAKTEDEAADKAEAVVRGWLREAANDNDKSAEVA